MATKTQVLLVDDLNESPADETVNFGLDGTDYSIDLSDENAKAMRESLDRYIQAGRKTGKAKAAGNKANYTRSRIDADSKTVRAWAQSNGIEVSPNGRLKKDVVDQFRAAHA